MLLFVNYDMASAEYLAHARTRSSKISNSNPPEILRCKGPWGGFQTVPDPPSVLPAIRGPAAGPKPGKAPALPTVLPGARSGVSDHGPMGCYFLMTLIVSSRSGLRTGSDAVAAE